MSYPASSAPEPAAKVAGAEIYPLPKPERSDEPGAGPTAAPDAKPEAPTRAPYDPSVQYERLAARLLLAGETDPVALAVTSSVQGEGVTTVCVGLAVALAMSTPKSVLLLDANLRRPALHELLGAPLQPGFRDLVTDHSHAARPYDTRSDLGVSPLVTTVPNLSLLPSGAAMDHPAQLMTSDAARMQIDALRSRFHYLVIDCPPLLSAVDAASICRLASGVLMVVRAGVTPRDEVKRAQGLLEGVPILGVVLTGA